MLMSHWTQKSWGSQNNNFDTKQLMITLQDNAAHKVWPEVYYELNNVSKVAIPVISDSLEKELRNLGPKLSKKFQTEAIELEKNLGSHMQNSLQRELDMKFAKEKDRLTDKYKDKLNTESLSDELLIRLQAKSQQWAQNQLDSIFTEHIAVLQSLNETVLELQKEATQSKNGVTPKANVDDLILITSEILSARMGDK